MPNNILITGVSGFVGSSLARYLSRDLNNNIVGLTFDSHWPELRTPCNHVVVGDIRDPSLARRLISDYEINQVYHMAAQAIVRICGADPVTAYDINVMGTVHLLDACRTVGKGIKSVLISTSDKAYGHVTPPYNEQTPLDPYFTYEASKACQDIVARSFALNYGLPVKVARCSNIYGPGDRNRSRLIPNSIITCLQGKPPVLHNGVHNYVREFVYIDDIMEAFQLISEKGNPGEAYCVGGTGHYRVIEVIDLIVSLVGNDVKPEIHEKDSTFKEIEKQWIDSSKLQTLGWGPKWNIVDGLKATIEYYRKEFNYV